MCFLEDPIRRRSDKVKILYGVLSLMDTSALSSRCWFHSKMDRSTTQGGVIGSLLDV